MASVSEGRTALITGATGDIGKALTKALISDGYTKLALAGLEADILKQMTTWATPNCDLVPFPVNLLNAEEADGLFAKAQEALGHIDVLVNNAGITRDSLILKMADKDWDMVLRLNLEACFRVCRAAARPMMVRQYGRIINTSSVVGCMGNPGQTNYCASKAGLIGFSKALAQELGARNITVNCVAPGFIESAMTAAIPEAAQEKMLSMVPLRRMGLPEEVADAVAFLASDRAAYITGTVLHVNGGLYMA